MSSPAAAPEEVPGESMPVSPSSDPLVTIGIPVHNEESTIGPLLDQCAAHRSVLPIEVIVASDHSTDQTDRAVAMHSEVDYIRLPSRQGKVAALRAILEQARGEFMLMTDGDVILDDDGFSEFLRTLDRNRPDALAGAVVPLCTGPRHMYLHALISCLAWHELRFEAARVGGFLYPTGQLLAVRRELLLEAPLIDKAANDAEIAAALWERGIRIGYSRKARVYTAFPETLTGYLRQRVRTRCGRRTSSHWPLFDAVEAKWRRAVLALAASSKLLPHVLCCLAVDIVARRLAIRVSRRQAGLWRHWEKVNSTRDASRVHDPEVLALSKRMFDDYSARLAPQERP